MDFRAIAINEEIEQKISIWADAIIKKHKQLRYDGKKSYLQWERPWYSGDSDAWADDTWWFEVEKNCYEKLKDREDTWLSSELKILSYYSPQEYTEIARQHIDWWYEQWHGHDPEGWFELVLQVYPEHPLLTEDLPDYPENYREWSILAWIGNEDAISFFRDEILEGIKDPEYFVWANSALEAVGYDLALKIFSTEEIEQVKQIEMEIARNEIPTQNKAWDRKARNQQSILTPAILLKWWDIVDALAESQPCLNELFNRPFIPNNDILWWSLTNQKLLTQKFVVHYKSHPDINRCLSNSLALAIAWNRCMN